MESPFRMLLQRDNDRLHARLTGRFDGKAASLLVRLLRDHGDRFSRVCIDTRGLGPVDAFGLKVLRVGLNSLGWQRACLDCIGGNVPELHNEPARGKTVRPVEGTPGV